MLAQLQLLTLAGVRSAVVHQWPPADPAQSWASWRLGMADAARGLGGAVRLQQCPELERRIAAAAAAAAASPKKKKGGSRADTAMTPAPEPADATPPPPPEPMRQFNAIAYGLAAFVTMS